MTPGVKLRLYATLRACYNGVLLGDQTAIHVHHRVNEPITVSIEIAVTQDGAEVSPQLGDDAEVLVFLSGDRSNESLPVVIRGKVVASSLRGSATSSAMLRFTVEANPEETKL